MPLEGYLSPQTSHAIERQPPQALFLAAVSNTTQTPSCVCQLAMLLKGYLFPQTRYKHRCVRQLKVDFSPKHDTNTKLCMPVDMLWKGYLFPQTRHKHQVVYASWYAMEGVFISPNTTQTPSCVCQLVCYGRGIYLLRHDTNTKLCMPSGYAIEGVFICPNTIQTPSYV